jgi:lipopolysaccharide biosynthesis glycosyltransferase
MQNNKPPENTGTAVENRQDRLDVLFTADNNFVMQMGISILSVLEHNYQFYRRINVHVVSLGIAPDGLRQIESLFARRYQDCQTTLICHDGSDYQGIFTPVVQSPLGYSVYLRLLVDRLAGADTERLIYIDSDCLVVDKLTELTILDLGDSCFAAVIDLQAPESRKQQLGLNLTDNYINAGVLVCNLPAIRAQEVESRLIDFVNTTELTLEYHDQDAINVVLRDSIQTIHPRYNAVSTFFFMNRSNYRVFVDSKAFGEKHYYPTEEFLQAQASPAILHFFGSNIYGRPWLDFCHHPYRTAYLQLKQDSPWRETPLIQSGLSPFARLAAGVMRFALRTMPISILDLLSRIRGEK